MAFKPEWPLAKVHSCVKVHYKTHRHWQLGFLAPTAGERKKKEQVTPNPGNKMRACFCQMKPLKHDARWTELDAASYSARTSAQKRNQRAEEVDIHPRGEQNQGFSESKG